MIDHVNIVVADLERAARFYETLFGARRGFSATLEGEWIERVTGLPNAQADCLFLEFESGARLELIRYQTPESKNLPQNSQPHTFGIRHLAFNVPDIETTLQKVRELGLEPLSEAVEVPFRVGNLGRKRLAYFPDFDGTLIEAASYSP